jgi:hypothetical protein
MSQPARCSAAQSAPSCPAPDRIERGDFQLKGAAALFAARAVMPVTALRGRCAQTDTEVGDREFPRCLITNDHMNCGSRFPPKRKRSFPILAVRPTLKLAAALGRQAAIP